MIKKIIKNILPHYIVSKRKSNQDKLNKRFSILPYTFIGDSICLDKFSVSILNAKDRRYVTIGNDNMLECQITFESGSGDVIIGNNVYIGNSNLICRSRIEFGDNIFVAWGVYFYDHDSHSMDYRERQRDIQQQLTDFRNGDSFIKNKNWDVVKSAPIKIRDNAWIGMNSLILKGVTIGEGAIVAAGSVVTKDVEPFTLVGGNPAKFIKKLEIDHQ